MLSVVDGPASREAGYPDLAGYYAQSPLAKASSAIDDRDAQSPIAVMLAKHKGFSSVAEALVL